MTIHLAGQCALGELPDVERAALVARLHQAPLLFLQAGRGRHVADADAEAAVHEEPGGHPAQPPHGQARRVLPEVPQQHVEDVGLRAAAHRALVHAAGQQLAVPDHHIAVVDAELPVLGVALALGLEVGLHLALPVGLQQQPEDLLAGPEGLGLENGGLRQAGNTKYRKYKLPKST